MRLPTWVVLGLMSLLAACGGGGGSEPPAPAPAPQPPSTPYADVTLTLTGPNTSVAGGTSVQLEIVIANNGTDAARNVTVGGQFGSGIAAFIVGCAATGGATCPQSGNIFPIPSLAANSSLRLAVIVVVPVGLRGSTNCVFSVAADNDSQPNNNSATYTVTAYNSDLAVSGQGPTTPVISGATALYTMRLTNLGPDTAVNATLENVVGPGQTLRSISCSASGGAQCPATTGSIMTVPAMPVGGILTFTVIADVAPTTIGFVVNTMYVAPQGDPVTSNNVATASGSTQIAVGATTFIQLQSDSGDYIGGGRSYTYTKATAALSLTANGGNLSINVQGDERWSARIALPAGYNQFIVGTYQATRFGDGNTATVDWGGEGRGCNQIAGTVIIDNVLYTGTTISEIDIRFEQHCEGLSPALRGQIHWLASDATVPPGPQNPPPAGLWDAPSSATPSSGSYVYLKSDAGDYIGGGATHLYTAATAQFTVTLSDGHLMVDINGDESWGGDFIAMNSITQLQPGYYGALRRYPFHNPVRGGLNWSGEGRGCNVLSGWFVVDSITIVSGTLTAFDLRFEQHCEGQAAALRGKIHWILSDALPPGPQNPPPSGLWNAAPGTTPTSGNYVYLQSDAGDYIGLGQTYTYTQANALLNVSMGNTSLTVGVNGDDTWTGNFQGMNSISQLQPGYYGGLQRYPFHNPVRGGLSWYGNGRGCNTLSGWFVIDSITFAGSSLISVDARFEQHCEGGTPALHGKIHWVAGGP